MVCEMLLHGAVDLLVFCLSAFLGRELEAGENMELGRVIDRGGLVEGHQSYGGARGNMLREILGCVAVQRRVWTCWTAWIQRQRQKARGGVEGGQLPGRYDGHR